MTEIIRKTLELFEDNYWEDVGSSIFIPNLNAMLNYVNSRIIMGFSNFVKADTNAIQNMMFVDFEGISFMFYAQSNRHHHNKLTIIQTNNELIKGKLLNEIDQFGISNEDAIAGDLFPAKMVRMYNYDMVLFFGDENQPDRLTLRIMK